MARPTEPLRRPDRISIRQGVIRCHYGSCQYSSGPYLDRDHAVLAAQAHYENLHLNPTHHRRRTPWQALRDSMRGRS